MMKNTMKAGYKSSRQVATRIGTYQIDHSRGERKALYRPSGMLVGWFETVLEARLAAWNDCAALCGERY